MASEFTRTFLKDADTLLASMRQLEKGADPAEVSGTGELERALHSLKSGSAFLGWEDLEAHAHALEDLLKEGFHYGYASLAAASLADTDLTKVISAEKRMSAMVPQGAGPTLEKAEEVSP